MFSYVALGNRRDLGGSFNDLSGITEALFWAQSNLMLIVLFKRLRCAARREFPVQQAVMRLR
jgi:hypothetical protein